MLKLVAAVVAVLLLGCDPGPDSATAGSEQRAIPVPEVEEIAVVTPRGLLLPAVERGAPFPLTVTLAVTQAEVTVDGVLVARLSGDPPAFDPADLESHLVRALLDRLVEKRETSQVIGAAGGLEFDGTLALLVDSRTSFPVVRDILYTAGQAQFTRFSLGAQSLSGARVAVELGLPQFAGPGHLPTEPILNLTVLLDSTGFTLASPVLEGLKEPLPCTRSGCPDVDAWDYAALSRRARALGAGFPDEEHVVIVPAGTIPLTVLLRTVSALHADEGGVIFASPILAGGAR